jgi:tetratricopeptide (TPR) repeat protein
MHRTFLRIFLSLVLSSSFASSAADKPPVETPQTAPEGSNDSARAYLQLQDQLHTALLAIEQARRDAETNAQQQKEAVEQARQETEATARRSAELINARLRVIEQTLTNQHDSAVEAMQKSNRFMIALAAIFGGIGFVAMLLTAFCLWRALTRVAQITSSLQPFHAMNVRPLTSGLGGPDAPFVTLNGPEMSSSRLLGAIERLEKRIQELERSAPLPAGAAAAQIEDGESATRLNAILAKGQAFLDANEPERALACFDQALELVPNDAESLVKKGSALEQLKRLEEAIEYYDKAIAADEGMTVAYLHKGAVFNQLERFNEALECYEQALRTQQKPVNS